MAPRDPRNVDADLTDVERFTTEQRRRWLSERTIGERRAQLERFAAFIHPTALAAATAEQIDEWLDTCNIGARGRYAYLGALSAFYDFAVRYKLATANPARQLPRPRIKRLVPRPIRDDDLRLAMRAADPRMRAWLALAAYDGLRCKEIAHLRREDLLLTHEPPMLMVSSPKGGNEALLPLNPVAERALRVHGLPKAGFVFLKRDGWPYTPGTVSCMIHRYLHGMGIECSAHQLRHWFATTVYESTGDIRLTQEVMRHASIQSTTIYTAFNAKAAATAVQALDVGDYSEGIQGAAITTEPDGWPSPRHGDAQPASPPSQAGGASPPPKA